MKYDIAESKFISILLYNTSYFWILNVLLIRNIKSKHPSVIPFWKWEPKPDKPAIRINKFKKK